MGQDFLDRQYVLFNVNCPRSIIPIYTITYYILLVKTSRTYCISMKQLIFIKYSLLSTEKEPMYYFNKDATRTW